MPVSDLFASEHRLGISAAREAGELAMKYFGGDFARWDKGGNNPVTEADLAVDRLLRGRLSSFDPEYGWLSEETEDDKSRHSARRSWVVDPIDGTRAFIRGQPHFAISIALVEDAQPVCAVVFNPATNELFDAVAEGPARLNGEVITVSGKDALQDARMLASKGVFEQKRWKSPWPAMHVEARNSIAYKGGLIAAGIFDGCLLFSGAYDWDLAAADLIVRAAGGCMTDHSGQRLRFNQQAPRQQNMVAAGPELHALLLERLSWG